MAKRQPRTPRSKIKAALTKLFSQSRERSETLKRDKYTCQRCGGKQSKAKGKEFRVEVHHKSALYETDKNGRRRNIYKEKVIDVIQEFLLCDPSELQTLCPQCHDEIEPKWSEIIDKNPKGEQP